MATIMHRRAGEPATGARVVFCPSAHLRQQARSRRTRPGTPSQRVSTAWRHTPARRGCRNRLASPTSRTIFSIAMPSSDSSETNVYRRSRGTQSLPNPALPQTSWNIFRTCLAPSGVPVAVVNTLPVSCPRDPAASRSAAWSTCHCLSAQTAIRASFSARRNLGVFASPPGPIRAQHRDRRRIAVQVDVVSRRHDGASGRPHPGGPT